MLSYYNIPHFQYLIDNILFEYWEYRVFIV